MLGRRSVLAGFGILLALLLLFSLRPGVSAGQTSAGYAGVSARWTCGLDDIGATLTECRAAPGANFRLYITDIVAQSTTATAGTFGIRNGTGTNCGTGTANVLPSSTATARYVSPANTIAPTVMTFSMPIPVAMNTAICVLGVGTNTTTIEIIGFTAR